jgi:endonuclease/exonuclease/phosphatase family metal-dependent hydrolase
MTHFSLSKRIRHKQFAELEELIRKRKRVILCGDFNVFSGPEELYHLLGQCNLRIVNQPKDFTFPTCKPRKALDLFLCSHDVRIMDIRVLDTVTASDHLPVILEVALHHQEESRLIPSSGTKGIDGGSMIE